MHSIVTRLRTESDAALRTTLLGRREILQTHVNQVIAQAYALSSADMAVIVGD